MATGELFFIVDSDDCLTDNSLEKIIEVEKSIPPEKKNEFAGVCGLKGFSETELVGTTYEGKYLDITSLDRPKYKITGDKAEVFYTEILKKYPFPEFDGEKYVTPCVVWDKIAYEGYKLRFFNDIVYICEYLPDGLTYQFFSLLNKNPRGYGVYLYQSALYNKINGFSKWNSFADFFYKHRKTFSPLEICKILHVNPVNFFAKLFGLRIIYKIYK